MENSFRGWLALSPAIVFVLLYVIVSMVIGDFYVMPVTVALLAASVWGITVWRGPSLRQKIEKYSEAAAHSNILYMIWIFVMAGAFAALAKGIGAIEATVQLTLMVFPPSLLLPAIFLSACFISLSIGTSVGTVVALVPLTIELAGAGEASVPLYVAACLGGAFFGDNLSFISDTTIAATRSQGCGMADKFKANLRIVLPAAIISLGLYALEGQHTTFIIHESHVAWWLVIPYLVIIVAALYRIDVTIVLLMGIVTALCFSLFEGFTLLDSCKMMGEGIDSMGNLIIITLLAAGLLGLVKAMGGIDFMLRGLSSHVTGRRGAQAVIAFIVSIVNLCTANNTVAIITVGGLSIKIAQKYGISPRKSASLLDTSSCIVQSLIPYGAQTLLATGLAGISPAAPWVYMYYPWVLALCVIISIILPTKAPSHKI